MNKEQPDFKPANPAFIIFTYYLIAVPLFFYYLYVYQYAPFSDQINNNLLNSITAFSALIVAGIASAIYLHYQPEDRPRKVWLNLMLGCWLWFFAETLWGILSFYTETGEVPTPSIADAGWVGGFIFFSIAFYHQYLIIFPAQKKKIIAACIGAWIFAALVPLIGFLISPTFTREAYINYYYPIADFAVGIAGIALVLAFQGGALTRPWIGLFVFTISDLLYAWAEQTGMYEWSSQNSSALTLAIDSSYLAAYLILGFGFLSHWILINYGLRGKR